MKTLEALWTALMLGMCPGPILDRDPKEASDPEAAAKARAFTAELGAYFGATHHFRWLLDTSYGVEAGEGRPDWSAYWTGVSIVKQGDSVTFRHDPERVPDNMMIPTSRILGQAAAAYLWAGNASAGRLAEQYAKGLSATMLGMVWDENDPLRSIMARAVIAQSHGIVRSGGRRAWVDYEPWRRETTAWNTDTIHIAQNPYWGDIYVKNTRSKDDVPHIYLATSILPHLSSFARDPAIAGAAAEAYRLMQGFSRDIVDHQYWIRSKRADGSLFYPGLYPQDDRLSDLASFSLYRLLVPQGECSARMSTALIGYDSPRGHDCKDGLLRLIDLVGAEANFYNYLIFSSFQLAAGMLSLEQGRDEAARELVAGMASRIDFDMNLKDSEIPDGQVQRWRRELAVFIVYAAAAGVALRPIDIRLVQDEFRQAMQELIGSPVYDPWALPDGVHPLHPAREGIGTDEMGAFFWYCWSPYRLPGAALVDCDGLRATVATLD